MKDQKLEAYCDTIEREFFRLKGRPGMLSPDDFGRARSWHEGGVPLSVAVEGIRLAFAERLAGRDRGIDEVNGLSVCERFIAELVSRRRGS